MQWEGAASSNLRELQPSAAPLASVIRSYTEVGGSGCVHYSAIVVLSMVVHMPLSICCS